MASAAPDTPTLYIRLRKRVRMAKGTPILLGRVAQILIEPEWEEPLKRIVLHTPNETDGNYVVIDMMTVVRKVKELIPHVTVEHFGEPQTVVELKDASASAGSRFLLVPVWLLLFVGSGLAIMNFHTDVSMQEVHRKLFWMITGRRDAHPLIMQIPYSLGVGAGMVIFFNRLFRKKFNEEPNPLEVEMFMYEESVHQYVVKDEFDKRQESGRE
jgi:stage V sporulation protein AA